MINVTKTYLPDINKYKTYINRIFELGWITNNGQFVQELEKRLKEYLGVRNIVLVSNGTLALQIAYKVLDLSGDVITTPFSFVATTSSLLWEGLNPHFVDIDKETLNIDYRKIEENITSGISAIVPVHVFGNGCEVNEINNIAKKNKLKVIYDAAHAFGVKYKNESILNQGDISVLSFHATKVFHTIEGGALVINDDSLYLKAKRMVNFGIDDSGKINGLGINAKMNELQAAMGLCILEDIDEIFEQRKKIYEFYMEAFYNNNNVRLQKHNEDFTCNYSYFPVILQSEKCLLDIMRKLNKQNIYPRRYFYPSLDTLSYINNRQYTAPISNDISTRILCLPLYHSLEFSNLEKIVNIFKE